MKSLAEIKETKSDTKSDIKEVNKYVCVLVNNLAVRETPNKTGKLKKIIGINDYKITKIKTVKNTAWGYIDELDGWINLEFTTY